MADIREHLTLYFVFIITLYIVGIAGAFYIILYALEWSDPDTILAVSIAAGIGGGIGAAFRRIQDAS